MADADVQCQCAALDHRPIPRLVDVSALKTGRTGLASHTLSHGPIFGPERSSESSRTDGARLNHSSLLKATSIIKSYAWAHRGCCIPLPALPTRLCRSWVYLSGRCKGRCCGGVSAPLFSPSSSRFRAGRQCSPCRHVQLLSPQPMTRPPRCNGPVSQRGEVR